LSCGCPDGVKNELWKEVSSTTISLYEVEEKLFKLTTLWCEIHGEEYINAALAEIKKASK
jgi:hypothetical protein